MNKPKTMADKYLKDGVDVEELASEINELMLFCQNYTQPFRAYLVEFFNKPIKPTLTEDEKVILRNVKQTEYQYITRNVGFSSLRLKGVDKEGCQNEWRLAPFNHLFQFIQPRRRI